MKTAIAFIGILVFATGAHAQTMTVTLSTADTTSRLVSAKTPNDSYAVTVSPNAIIVDQSGNWISMVTFANRVNLSVPKPRAIIHATGPAHPLKGPLHTLTVDIVRLLP